MSELAEITDQSFDEQVLRADVPTLADFWAEWCMPCRTMGARLSKLAESYGAKARIVKLDVQANPETPASLGVISLPTLILFVGGEQVGRQTGLVHEQKIAQMLEPFVR